MLKLGLELNRKTFTLKNLFPFNQKHGLPIFLPLYGNGSGKQPFKKVSGYDHWFLRASVFPAFSDSAIAYFRKGNAAGFVLPETPVDKMIPQIAALIKDVLEQSFFYGPINKLPEDYSKKG